MRKTNKALSLATLKHHDALANSALDTVTGGLGGVGFSGNGAAANVAQVISGAVTSELVWVGCAWVPR